VKWVDKLPTPLAPLPPFTRTSQKKARSVPAVDVHALLDIKYSLIILENATYLKYLKYYEFALITNGFDLSLVRESHKSK
jgi:hypothetical protein